MTELSTKRTVVSAQVLACCLLLAGPINHLVAQNETSTTSEQPSEAKIESLLDGLDAESYSARQLAYLELRSIGAAVITAIERRLPTASPSSASSMVRLLAEMRPEGSSETGLRALEVLRKTAENRLTFSGDVARRTMDAIASQLRTECERRLRELNVIIDVGPVQILSYPTEVFHLEIDDRFTGKASDLDSLPHLVDVEFAVLSGNKITSELLSKVALLPSLKYLQLRKVPLSREGLRLLQSFPPIDTLDIVYCDLTDDSIDDLAAIGGVSQLSLFGTGMSREASERLREKAKQLEVVYHGGGFLGIRSRDQNGITIDIVVEGGPAEKAGLQAGDRVIKMNGNPLGKFEDLRVELAKFRPTDSVTVVFERPFGSKMIKQEVTVQLGERP
jgi:PDZ domain